MVSVVESAPAEVTAQDTRGELVRDIGRYVTKEIMREIRENESNGRLEAIGAVLELIEAAGNLATARIIERVETPRQDSSKHRLIAC